MPAWARSRFLPRRVRAMDGPHQPGPQHPVEGKGIRYGAASVGDLYFINILTFKIVHDEDIQLLVSAKIFSIIKIIYAYFRKTIFY